MKKKSIILSVATCCFAAFTACDMDLASETSIPTNQSVQSVQDCGKYSNLFHAEWRGYVQNSYTMDALVQSGLITATADYGNTYGAFYRWDYTITDGAFSGCWSDNYNFIANANVLLKGAEALLADNSLSDDDRKEIRLYMGHAYFTRAMIRPPLLTNMVFLLLKNIIRHHLLPEHIRGVARWRRLINRSTAIWQKQKNM